MLEFMYQAPGLSKNLMKHLKYHAITELILKLINLEDTQEGAGAAMWLKKEGLIDHFFNLLDSSLEPEVHSSASQTLVDIITLTYQLPVMFDGVVERSNPNSNTHILVAEMKSPKLLKQLFEYMLDRSKPNSSSSLVNGINVLMELTRRYCSEIESAEMQHQEFIAQVQQGQASPPYPLAERTAILSTELNSLFVEFCTNLPKLGYTLDFPTNCGLQSSTMGKQIPLGAERLKICELFAEFIHLQYLFTSSPLFELMIVPIKNEDGETLPTVAASLMLLGDCFIKESIMERCVVYFN
jgi:hypothetical protein